MTRRISGFWRGVACLVVLLFAAGTARASAYYVDPVEGPNQDDALLATLRSLIEGAVSEAGGGISETLDGSDFELKTRLLRLGDDYIVLMSRRTVDTGKTVFMAKLKARTVEELDLVTTRLTRAVLKGKEPEADTKVGEVLPSEQQRLDGPRFETRSSTYFGMGPYVFTNMGLPAPDSPAYSFTFGRQWEVAPQASINLDYDAAFRDFAFLEAIELGGCYYFMDGPVTPFAGLDMVRHGALRRYRVDHRVQRRRSGGADVLQEFLHPIEPAIPLLGAVGPGWDAQSRGIRDGGGDLFLAPGPGTNPRDRPQRKENKHRTHSISAYQESTWRISYRNCPTRWTPWRPTFPRKPSNSTMGSTTKPMWTI
jgi:hypothetical protein